jgi:hypothetical protein
VSALFFDGHGYCDFTRADYKYQINDNTFVPTPRSAFWPYPSAHFGPAGPVSGSRAGSIDVGPYPGTFSLHMQATNPWWWRNWYSPSPISDPIVAMWLYPMNISGTHTFLTYGNNLDYPNLGQSFVVQIRDDGKIIIAPSPNPNLFSSPQLFGVPDIFPHWPTITHGPNVGISTATLPINTAPPDGTLKGWSHICLVLHYSPSIGQATAQLFVNGCLDLSGTSLNLTAAPNLITPVWLSTDGSELCVSQFVICDKSGSQNNTNVSPFAAIQTSFPTSNVTNDWSGGGFSVVNSNPGPPASGYLTLTTLASPDELFGIAALSPVPQVLGVAVNLCVNGPGQTLAGLFKKATKTPVAITPYLAPTYNNTPPAQIGDTAGFWTRQSITELDPWTGKPWLIADISAAAWGMRGIVGTGEQVSQVFTETLWQTGPAQCGGGSYAYGQTG